MESAVPSCFNCDLRPDRLFCDLPTDALRAFDALKEVAVHPRGDVLFAEGRPAKGIFILCDGRAKLSVCSDKGKRLLLRIAGPGEVLGLGASMAGKGYEVTAEVLDEAQIAFLKRKDMMKFLREHPQACMQVVRLLSQDLHTAYDRVRSMGLARTRRPRNGNVRAVSARSAHA